LDSPYESDSFGIILDPYDDVFFLVDSVINFTFDLPFECDLIVCRSLGFGVCESSLVDTAKVRHIVEDTKVEDTYV